MNDISVVTLNMEENLYMIEEKIEDILQQTDTKYICHQVNCKGVMGAGLAKQIKQLLTPHQFQTYYSLCKKYGRDCLGQVQMIDLTDGRSILNLFGEDIPTGTGLDTDYIALGKSLTTAKKIAAATTKSLAIPGFLGCGLAGGDWEYVYKQILVPLFWNSDVVLYIFWLNDELYQESREMIGSMYSAGKNFTPAELKLIQKILELKSEQPQDSNLEMGCWNGDWFLYENNGDESRPLDDDLSSPFITAKEIAENSIDIYAVFDQCNILFF